MGYVKSYTRNGHRVKAHFRGAGKPIGKKAPQNLDDISVRDAKKLGIIGGQSAAKKVRRGFKSKANTIAKDNLRIDIRKGALRLQPDGKTFRIRSGNGFTSERKFTVLRQYLKGYRYRYMPH